MLLPAPADIPADRRQIINRRRLVGEIEALVAQHGRDADRLRPHVMAAVRAAMAAGRDGIQARFGERNDGATAVRELAWLIDQIVRTLADYITTYIYPSSATRTTGETISLVALGGYGRGECSPFSDIDLMFLLPYKRTPLAEQVVEYMLYMLWDLGLKVGHAVRSVDDCIRMARSDFTVRTALLESRWLWGDRTLYGTFRKRFAKEIVAPTGLEFVQAKLAERDARHTRWGDSRYVLEPNVKEGKGGLRDLQTLFWIAKYLYRVEETADLVAKGVLSAEEAARFDKAQAFLWTVRSHLHWLTGRAEDRLTFDVQSEIGRRLGYTDHAGTKGVERFMKHYFLIAKDVGDLTRIFAAQLEAEAKRPPRSGLFRFAFGRKEVEGFALETERLAELRDGQFRDAPIDMLRLFAVAQRHDLDIHPKALRSIRRNLRRIGPELRADPAANALFLGMLTGEGGGDPELTLRRLNEAGVLGRFVPDFARVACQMQYDMYHCYTVDEHTLFALGNIHRIVTGQAAAQWPQACAVAPKIASRRALYAAILLHDIAKGRGGDHSVLGARVAAKVCPQWGLTSEETETVAWLVRWHLAMSDAAFKRDLEDPQTLADFVALVTSPERLRLLLVLTTADISAVGPGRWNNWKATLLGHLYARAEEMLSGGLAAGGRDQRVAGVQAAVRERLRDWSDADFAAHAARGYPAYWLACDPETLAHQARLVREAERAGQALTVESRIDRGRAVTEITVYTPDHPGLFARLAGAMAVSGATIVDAKIFTMTNGMALDVFSVQDAGGGAFDSADKLARLAVMIERALEGKLRVADELAKRKPNYPVRARVFNVAPRVLIDNTASNTHTVIEVNGRDRIGLLHDLTRALSGLSLQISSAKISTWGQRVVDVFYVKDVFGLKVTHQAKLDQTRRTLLEALAEPEERKAG